MTVENNEGRDAKLRGWLMLGGQPPVIPDALASELLAVFDERDALEEKLRRSATVCPKDGCMLWKGHKEKHATKDQVAEALAANSHGKRRR